VRKHNSKKKGNRYENWVAKQLSLAVSNGSNDRIFVRSFCSGAIGTLSGKKSSNIYGDISYLNPLGQSLVDNIIIECKSGYKSNSLETLLLGKKCLFSEWIDKLELELKQSGISSFAIIYHKPCTGDCVIVSASSPLSIDGADGITFFYRLKKYYLVSFSDFLTSVKSFVSENI